MLADADESKRVALSVFLNGKHLNFDRIVYDPKSSKETIGDMLIRKYKQYPSTVAGITDVIHKSSLRNLIRDVLADEKAFEALEKYYKNKYVRDFFFHSRDIDNIPLDPPDILKSKARTIGDELDARATEPNARKILFLVRGSRQKEMKKFSELLWSYRKNKAKLPDLKKWFEEHPFDIDTVNDEFRFMDDGKFIETYGDIINKLRDPALLELFKSTRSSTKWAQEVAKYKAAVFWDRVLIATGVVIGAGLYYYWRTQHAQKDDEEKIAEQPIVAA